MHIIQITTIMGIIITSKNAKYPRGMKLASKIVSYLFEEQYGELEQMPKRCLFRRGRKDTLQKGRGLQMFPEELHNR